MREMIPFPDVWPVHSAADYFWANMPWAMPGFFSFIIGGFLAGFCLYSRYHSTEKNRRELLLAAALTMFSFGALALNFSMRAVIQSEKWILIFSDFLTILSWPYIIGTTWFAHILIGRNNRIMKFLFFSAPVIYAAVCLQTFFAGSMTDKFFYLPFGKYPEGSKVLKAATVYVFSGAMYTAYLFLRRSLQKENRNNALNLGMVLMILLVASNGPALLGIKVYPMGIFIFIPLLLITYGIFKADFLNINTMLFEKQIMFYVSMFLSSLLLIFFIVIAILGLNREVAREFPLFMPYGMMSLVSMIAIFILAVTIGSANTRSPVNQWSAIYMLCIGFYSLSIFTGIVKPPLLIYKRLTEVCYIVFLMGPSAGLRAIFHIWQVKVPKWIGLIDLFGLSLIVLNFSPYFRVGYFEYYFGYFPRPGPPFHLFSAVSVFLIAYTLHLFYKTVKSGTTDAKKNVTVFSLILGAIFIASAIPALNGIPVLPLGIMQFIPGGVLAYGVIKYDAFKVRGVAYSISRRFYGLQISNLIFLIFIFVYSGAFIWEYSITLNALFLIIIVLWIFILTKPVSDQLNSTMVALDNEKEKSDELIRNILPVSIAEELKTRGTVQPVHYDSVTIMFTDFKDFTRISARLDPAELVKKLDGYFYLFDDITARHKMEKLKTIGDAYMAAGGLPIRNRTHFLDVCLAALEIVEFNEKFSEISGADGDVWQIRIGIHTGDVVAGVIGKTKFVYDVWGDAVNVASRMESNATPGKINVSESVHNLARYFFDFEDRGIIEVKNRGPMKMYFLLRLKTRYSKDEAGFHPNEKFFEIYKKIRKGAKLVDRPEK